MAGYPPVGYQPVPIPQYAPQPQYAPPLTQYPPQPQYAPPPPTSQAQPNFGYQQQPVEEDGDDVSSIIKKHAKKAAQIAKRAASQYFNEVQGGGQSGQDDFGFQPRQSRRPAHDPRGRFAPNQQSDMLQTEQQDPIDALMDSFDRFPTEKLVELLPKYSPRSPEHEAISVLLEEREHSEEIEESEDLGDEMTELTFCGVRYYDDVSKEWISYNLKISAEDVQTLVDKVKMECPTASRIKWGKVICKGRKAESLSHKMFPIRGAGEKLASSQAQPAAQQPYSYPPQQDQNGLLKIVADQGAQNQRLMLDMMKEFKEKKSPFEDFKELKALLIDPQIEMMKVMYSGGKSNVNLDPIELANTMMGGAVKLAGMGGGGGKESGVDTVESLLKKFMPYIVAAMQQVVPPQENGDTTVTGLVPGLSGQRRLPAPASGQQRQAPPPQQQQQNPQLAQERALMQALINRTRRIIDLMLNDKLQLEQVPRYIYRNTQKTPEEGLKLLEIGLEGFEEVLKAVASQNEALKAYIGSPKIRKNAQWLYEEFCRLVALISHLIDKKKEEEVKKVIDWKAKVLIQTDFVGDAAAAKFKEIYNLEMPSLAEDLPSDDDDLPPDDDEELEEEVEEHVHAAKLPERHRKKKPSLLPASARNKEGTAESVENNGESA